MKVKSLKEAYQSLIPKPKPVLDLWETPVINLRQGESWLGVGRGGNCDLKSSFLPRKFLWRVRHIIHAYVCCIQGFLKC